MTKDWPLLGRETFALMRYMHDQDKEAAHEFQRKFRIKVCMTCSEILE